MHAPTTANNTQGYEHHHDGAKREIDWNPATNATALVRAFLRNWSEGNINWPMCLYIGVVHVAFAVGLRTLLSCKSQTLLLAFVLCAVRCVGVVRLQVVFIF